MVILVCWQTLHQLYEPIDFINLKNQINQTYYIILYYEFKKDDSEFIKKNDFKFIKKNDSKFIKKNDSKFIKKPDESETNEMKTLVGPKKYL